jgi:hypothetical protein
MDDVYKTIDDDIENGFHVIHIDFCHFKGTYEQRLEESKRAIEYIIKKNPEIIIEIGTDENKGDFLSDLGNVEREMKYFKEVAPIHFFVCQTGSLIREVNQVGSFNEDFLFKVKELSDKYQVNLKEHNADYLSSSEISMRRGRVDSLNIAPQYGVIQTILTLSKCYIYGINADDFLGDSYRSGKWKKWLHKNDESNKYLCSVIAGHYNFSRDSYKKLYEEISRHEDFKESIIGAITRNINMYMNNLK